MSLPSLFRNLSLSRPAISRKNAAKDEKERTLASITEENLILFMKSISVSRVYCSGTIRIDF